MFLLILTTTLLSLAKFAAGWGADTHPTIGYLAERYFLSETKDRIVALLANETQFHGSIGSAANWADRTKTPATAGWHFIDATDSPPNACSLNFNRDCPSKAGCVVSAIVSQTKILKDCIANDDVSQPCSDALKFLVHFFGDITQPLHCSGMSRGGNDIEVKFGNRRRNLHSCWDTYIPDKIVDRLDPPTFPTWTDQLHSRISSSPSSFLTRPSDWIRCVDPDIIEDCAVRWAKESNSYTCSYVYINFDTGADLSGEYFDGAAPIVETQVARAALRLGVFLNLMVAGKPGWSASKFTVQHPDGEM